MSRITVLEEPKGADLLILPDAATSAAASSQTCGIRNRDTPFDLTLALGASHVFTPTP